MKNTVVKVCSLSIALAGFSVSAQTTTLDFDSFIGVLSDYQAIPGTFGSDALNTPNIGVSYQTVDGSGGVYAPYVEFWDGSYGDLPAVAYAAANGYYAQVILTPQAGHSVTLDSFELGGWPNTDQANQTVEVLNGIGQVVWSDGGPLSVTIPGNGHLTLTPDISSSGPLVLEFGPSWNTGVDYVEFSQSNSVPDSGSGLALMAAALLGVCGLARRLPRQAVA
jgi:hypothetical protein